MKRLITIAIAGMFAMNASAQTDAIKIGQCEMKPKAELKDIMGEMGDAIESVVLKIRSGDMAGATDATQSLQCLILQSVPQVPASLSALAEADQKKALVTYKSMLAELLGAVVDLEGGLIDQDMVKIQGAFQAIQKIRESGHLNFNPDN